MKKIYLLLLIMNYTLFYGQTACCVLETNLIKNGDFEHVSNNQGINNQNNIDLASYWYPIWDGNNQADLYDQNNSATGFIPSPADGNYASCWIDNRVRDELYREGMQVQLGYNNSPITILPNSGDYNLSFEMAVLAGWGSSEIGIYGVYNPLNTIVNEPTSSHNPTNMNLFGANNTVLLATVAVPNLTNGAKQQVNLTFSANTANFPVNGIDHIFITRSSTVMSGGYYVAFDNFCFYNKLDTPQSDIEFVNTYQSIQQLPSQYGTTAVTTYCDPAEIILDGSNNQNETSYRIEVMPFNLLNWTSYPTVFDTGEVFGQVPNTTDISNSFPWSLNTVYRVKLSTKPCYTEDNIFFQIVSPPEINLPSSITVCDGNFQEICGPIAPSGSAYSYQWYSTQNIPLPTSVLAGEDMCFIPSQTGIHTLVVTEENGCTASHTITITDTIPQPDLGIVNCEQAPFSNINILNQGFDNPDYTITWHHNGQLVQTGGETLMMTIEQGEVTVTIAVDGCEPVSDTIEIYCCPDDLVITMNCRTGLMEVQNLPNNITINTMFWDYDFQTLPNSNSTSYQPTQEGVYSFGIVFTFPNGEKCHHFIHYEYTEEYCCEIFGSQAEVSLLNPNNNFYYVPNTPYGPMEIPAICQRVILDGSLSSCEDAYFISVAAFDPVSWSNDPTVSPNPIYEGWTQGQAPNYLDLTQPPFNITFTNQTFYMIQFAVGPDWDAEYILFRYNCDTQRKMIVSPNPTQGEFMVSMENNKGEGTLEILDLSGEVVYRDQIFGETPIRVDISIATPGVYFVNVTIKEEVYTERIIKN